MVSLGSRIKSKTKNVEGEENLLRLGKVLQSNLDSAVEVKGNERKHSKDQDYDGYGHEEETGAEAGNIKKKPVKKKEDPGKDIKLPPGNSKKIAD